MNDYAWLHRASIAFYDSLKRGPTSFPAAVTAAGLDAKRPKELHPNRIGRCVSTLVRAWGLEPAGHESNGRRCAHGRQVRKWKLGEK